MLTRPRDKIEKEKKARHTRTDKSYPPHSKHQRGRVSCKHCYQNANDIKWLLNTWHREGHTVQGHINVHRTHCGHAIFHKCQSSNSAGPLRDIILWIHCRRTTHIHFFSCTCSSLSKSAAFNSTSCVVLALCYKLEAREVFFFQG